MLIIVILRSLLNHLFSKMDIIFIKFHYFSENIIQIDYFSIITFAFKNPKIVPVYIPGKYLFILELDPLRPYLA